MRSDYRRHGFVPDDLPFVKRFEHIARTRWGWDEARIQDAYAWYRAAPVNQPREKLLADFYAHAERKGWPMHEADLAVAWHDNVEADGIESFALPEPPVRDDDARRRAEILHTLQTDSRRYFSDEAMQNELYEINARLGGEARAGEPAGRAASAGNLDGSRRLLAQSALGGEARAGEPAGRAASAGNLDGSRRLLAQSALGGDARAGEPAGRAASAGNLDGSRRLLAQSALGGATTDFVPPAGGNAATRKAEIQDAMREGRSGPYWRPGSTMPDEYRAILQRESEPATPDTTQTPAPPANTETSA